MRNYDDARRGTPQEPNHIKQVVSFEGLKFTGASGLMNATPTDIDGYLQLDSINAFIFFELKYKGGMPNGQKRAYEKLVDAINDGGGTAILILAVHGQDRGVINARNAIVTRIYSRYDGVNTKWYTPKSKQPLSKYLKRFIEEQEKK